MYQICCDTNGFKAENFDDNKYQVILKHEQSYSTIQLARFETLLVSQQCDPRRVKLIV